MAKQKFKITNWPTYNKALINRGSITFWLDDEAIQAWYESATPSSRGRPQRYSDLAITTVLVIKRVFRLTLRAAQGFIDSIFSLMNVPLRCPDYSCVSRRAKSVNISFKTPTRGEIAHLVIDSTGLKVFGNNLRRAHVRMKTLANDLQASKEKLQVQNRRLQYDAYHDSLTGMPNRLSFWQRLQEIVNQVRPYKGCAVVMLFDLDSFKDVNDTLGHDAGDKLLQDLASRLSFFRKTSETLYRLGGDEFAMLSYDLTEEMALERANVIREKISQPYQIYDAQINIDACIGIVISDGESRTDYLYKCADLALYEAKKEGSGHVQIFRPGMLQRLQENKSFEDDLLQALAHDEFKVYYQPIADTVTREIYGYEALVRWFHPVRGAVPPTVFIPVAEKIGLINALGEWVLKTACAEAASWATPLKVSVNVSPIQLMNTSLTDTIIEVLHQTGLDPRRLDLEITESDVFNENTRSLEILSQLRELGIQISIDDFGTGYSSLSRLSYFPFDKIKIDRSFVINIPEQKDDLDIVRLIISMGKSLHMRIVAEGVETEEQLASLQALGCDLVQGYLIGKPSPLR